MSGGGPVEKLPEHNLPEKEEDEEECLENPLDISTNLPENLIFSTFARLTGGGCGLPRYCSTFDIDTRRAELLVGRQIITM